MTELGFSGGSDGKDRVATREESGVLGFPSRRGLTPRGSQECNPVKDLESPSSAPLEDLAASHDSRVMTSSSSPCAWRHEFPGAAREAP